VRVHQRSPAGDDGRDQAVSLLARQVDQLRQELTALVETGAHLRGEVDSHTRTLRDLSDLLRRVSSNGQPAAVEDEAPGGGPEWMTVTDPAEAIQWLTTLSVWVQDVYRQYSPVPGCWPWHPPAVAELLACQGAWTAAVSAEAKPEAIATWHDRWRPGAQHRVDDLLAGCQRAQGLHVEGAARFDYDLAYLDEYAEHWTTSHDPAAETAPGLTLNRQDRR
jgi:hypothetical protein